MLFCDNIMLSKRDAPSLHLDFFHTKDEHMARFLFYKKWTTNNTLNNVKKQRKNIKYMIKYNKNYIEFKNGSE